MMKLIKWGLIPLVSLMLMACFNDPKAPTVENYKVALQKMLDTQVGTCINIINNVYVGRSASYDYDIVYSPNTSWVPGNRSLEILNTWVKRGVLELKYSKAGDEYSTYGYNYTDKAKKEFDISKDNKLICMGKRELGDLLQVSEPLVDQFDGETSVDIVATYQVTNVPDWINEIEDFKRTRQGKYKLILMHDGWVEKSLLK